MAPTTGASVPPEAAAMAERIPTVMLDAISRPFSVISAINSQYVKSGENAVPTDGIDLGGAVVRHFAGDDDCEGVSNCRTCPGRF